MKEANGNAFKTRHCAMCSIMMTNDFLRVRNPRPATLQELMEDPVMAADGFSYARAAIEDWLARGNGSSPMTGAPLAHQHLTPNLAVRSAVCILKRRAERASRCLKRG